MIINIAPKLPMRSKALTKDFYLNKMGFKEIADYEGYLIIEKDNIEIHFFEFNELDPKTNFSQVYIRVNDSATKTYRQNVGNKPKKRRNHND